MADVKCCHTCQVRAKLIHRVLEHLHPTAITWPFETWSMDVIGPINSSFSKVHRFILLILAIIDYFSKWVEAIPRVGMKIIDVFKFIKHHVIYYYDVSQWIIHDKGHKFTCRTYPIH